MDITRDRTKAKWQVSSRSGACCVHNEPLQLRRAKTKEQGATEDGQHADQAKNWESPRGVARVEKA